MRSSRLSGLLAVSLATSLAANAWLLSRRSERHAAGATAEARSADAPAGAACEVELEACRQTAGALALNAWARSWTPDPTAAREPSGRAAPASPAARPAACEVALQKMRQEWLDKRDEMTATVVRDIPNDAKTRADAERDARRAADGLGLRGRESRAFEADYAELRARRIAQMAPAAQATPVDWARLLEQAQALFQEEDALVARDVGADGVRRFQESERSSRITIVSILATYAEMDWNDAFQGVP